MPAIPLGVEGPPARRASGRSSGPWSAASPSRASAIPGASTCCTSPRRGFRWLVEAKGHWSFVEPVGAGDIGDRYGQPVYEDEKFSHFQSGRGRRRPRAGGVLLGGRARGRDRDRRLHRAAADAVEGGRGLRDHLEPRHLHGAGDEVWKAFRLEGGPPEPEGVGPAPAVGPGARPRRCCRCAPPGAWPRSSSSTSRSAVAGAQDDPQAGASPFGPGRGLRRARGGHLRGADVRAPTSSQRRGEGARRR